MKLDDQVGQLTDDVVRLVCEHSHEREMPDLLRQVVEPMVKGHVERIHRLVLSGAMEECETYSRVQTEPAAQLALKQAAIRIAKLAPSVTGPKGPKKAIR
jgi:hypothetical protein